MSAYCFLLSIGVSPQVNQEFQKLKKGSLSFIICNLSKDNLEIIVEKADTRTDWDDFQAELPDTEVRAHE
jgi:cofilin